MKYPLYCVRDNKVGFQPQILVEQNDASAVRGFSFAINNPQGIMNYSPTDFDLFKIGDFDVDTGKIESCVPENVCSGYSVFTEKEKR